MEDDELGALRSKVAWQDEMLTRARNMIATWNPILSFVDDAWLDDFDKGQPND